MKCGFLDDRVEFFSILNEKLGEKFLLTPIEPSALDEGELIAACDVLIVGVRESRPANDFALLERAVLNPAGIPVVVFLPPNRQLMRDAIATGAYDCFVETSSMEELRIVLRRAAQFHELSKEVIRLREDVQEVGDFGCLIGGDEKMQTLFRFARMIANTDANILITGETGTGKELFARAIHQASTRARHPFMAVACSSLPETLIEAELFGHEKGAFTGAVAARCGRFEAAGQGTIFLDEIGELSPTLQVKLLRVLQERTFERLGSQQPRAMQARVICATNRDLKLGVQSGNFRSDLYYRLNTIDIELPPLRERRDDIVLLIHVFLQKYAEQHNRPARRVSFGAICALKRYGWPGNVRELQHVIERAVVICNGPEIGLQHLSKEVARNADEYSDSNSYEFEVRNFKRHLIEKRLKQAGNNKVQTARTLKISRSSLHRLIEELGIPDPLVRAAAS